MGIKPVAAANGSANAVNPERNPYAESTFLEQRNLKNADNPQKFADNPQKNEKLIPKSKTPNQTSNSQSTNN